MEYGGRGNARFSWVVRLLRIGVNLVMDRAVGEEDLTDVWLGLVVVLSVSRFRYVRRFDYDRRF